MPQKNSFQLWKTTISSLFKNGQKNVFDELISKTIVFYLRNEHNSAQIMFPKPCPRNTIESRPIFFKIYHNFYDWTQLILKSVALALKSGMERSHIQSVNFGYKRFRYKGFSLIRDYAKGS